VLPASPGAPAHAHARLAGLRRLLDGTRGARSQPCSPGHGDGDTLSEFLREDLDQRQGLDERACASYLARIARALEDIGGDLRAIRDEHCQRRESIHAYRCGDGVVFVASATTHKYRDVITGSGGLWRLTRTKAAGQTLGYLFTPETADAAAAQLARAGVCVEWAVS
jgi:hypothetical protein